MKLRNGGIIGPRNVPTLAAASGVWTLAEAQTSRGANVWPIWPPVGQEAFITAGTYSWVAPNGVTNVSIVAVGAGGNGAGGGGELRYKNNVTVIPGNSYAVVVGATNSTGGAYAGSSTFNSTTVVANGGQNGTSGSQGGVGGSGGTGDGGGNGGSVIGSSGATYLSGGGAGGYSGNGGNGFGNGSSNQAGSGGGGGGGYVGTVGDYQYGGGGGGVGILGQGADGAAGNSSTLAAGGGSGGEGGTVASGVGGAYGGGGGLYFGSGRVGARGAVRIIWPGTSRQFPSTSTGNL